MDAEDFKMPSPKRQRTSTPEPLSDHLIAPIHHVSSPKPGSATPAATNEIQTDAVSMLDVLMQHVEAESGSSSLPDPSNTSTIGASDPAVPAEPALKATHAQEQSAGNAMATKEKDDITHETVNGQEVGATRLSDTNGQEEAEPVASKDNEPQADNTTTTSVVEEMPANNMTAQGSDQTMLDISDEPATDATIPLDSDATMVNDTNEHDEMTRAAAAVNGIPPTAEEMEQTNDTGEPEWEIDSSPYESSTDSSSDDSSDDDSDDDDADGDYATLDPEEQARILMQGDGGSDDEGEKSKGKGEGSGLRTANEKAEDVLPIPEMMIDAHEKIEELGQVEGIVDRIVLIKAKVSGEYQVLDSGSLLCLEDRKVAGVVAELLGRVEQPMYMVRFRSEQEIEQRGLSVKGTTVFYVPSHASFVFTQPLKAIKGSDASNFHDEEVGDDEIEFSDDEAEAEHKRNLKLKRQGKSTESGRGRGGGRGGRGGSRESHPERSHDTNGSSYGNGSSEINYDDAHDAEEAYTPLARPSNLQTMMTSSSAEEPTPPSLPPFTHQDRGRGRGGGGGGRGGRDRGRGNRGFNSNRGNSNSQQRYPNHHTQQYTQSSPHQQNLFPFPPPPPMLTPQQNGYPGSFLTSPISPLPNPQFNFQPNFQVPAFNPAANGYPKFPQQQQSYQQHHQQQQAYQYQPPQFNQWPQQPYSQPLHNQPQYNSQPSQPSHPDSHNPTSEAQRRMHDFQTDLMRRQTGGGPQSGGISGPNQGQRQGEGHSQG